MPVATSLGDGIVYPQRGHLSESDEESGLLSASGHHYRDESCVEELVPMIRATENGSDEEDEDDDDGEWSKIDVKDFGSKNNVKVEKSFFSSINFASTLLEKCLDSLHEVSILSIMTEHLHGPGGKADNSKLAFRGNINRSVSSSNMQPFKSVDR